MKVLYFHQHFVTPRGSGGVRSYAMARRLIHRGHEVTMVCGSIGGGNTGLEGPFKKGMRRGLVDGIDVIELDLPYANNHGFITRTLIFLKFALRSVLLALREPCDVVVATTTPLTAGVPGIVARWLRRKPFVFEVRDLWPELPRAMGVITNPIILWLMSMLEWASYRSATKLIGLAPGIVEGIVARGVDRSKIALVPNGCDMEIFASETTAWRPGGIAPDDLMAVFAGTHGMANGLGAALDAAGELKKRERSDIKLLLIGNGALKEGLRTRAAAEGLDNVIFHDPVNKSKLAGLMAATDIGMQLLANVPAFYFGTSPNKFFDYIAAGLPVLNNYPGWLAEIIVENRCGFTVPPNDPARFADALEYAADHREELKGYGKNAQQLAEVTIERSELADIWVKWVTNIYSTQTIAHEGR